jgi:hypothetical protein
MLHAACCIMLHAASCCMLHAAGWGYLRNAAASKCRVIKAVVEIVIDQYPV